MHNYILLIFLLTSPKDQSHIIPLVAHVDGLTQNSCRIASDQFESNFTLSTGGTKTVGFTLCIDKDDMNPMIIKVADKKSEGKR